jgi:hypothetical protein
LALLLPFLTPRAVTAQAPALLIESLEVAHSERTLQTVTVRIRNTTSEPQSGLVWYVLAAPGEPEPWRRHAHSSSERSIHLVPGRSATVEFAGPQGALDGRFDLSVWLHATRPSTGERYHSDMRRHDALILIAPPFSFHIDCFASGDRDGAKGNALVRFSIRNNQKHTARIGVDYRITGPDERPEPDMRQLARVAELAAGVDYVVTLRHEGNLPRESLKLTGWIYELLDGRLVFRGTDVKPIEPWD